MKEQTTLVISDPDGGQKTIELAELTTVGRAPDNTVVCDDGSVSALHAQLREINGRYWVTDLDSSNGTTVNGMRIKEVELRPGDQLRFGRIDAVFSPVAGPQTKPNPLGNLGTGFKAALADLKSPEFKAELLPLEKQRLLQLKSAPMFWAVLLLAVVPSLLLLLPEGPARTTALSFYFAAAWALVFKGLVLEDKTPWNIALLSACFTGVGGSFLLWLLYQLAPVNPQTWAPLTSLQVGAFEEIVKLLPVAIYLLWQRGAASPLGIVVVAIFSGLGLGAFEEASQWLKRTGAAVALADEPLPGAAARLFNFVFTQAALAGIAGTLIAIARSSGKRIVALTLFGILAATLLHGLYLVASSFHWLAGTALAAIIFVVFFGYLLKLRGSEKSAPAEPLI